MALLPRIQSDDAFVQSTSWLDMKAIVLLNKAAGAQSATQTESTDQLGEFLADAGITADIRCVASEELHSAAKAAAASSIDMVIAGGGDGTLSTVAGALAGTEIPLGILPLGTLNHFAKDLGIPLDLAGAVAVIAARNIAAIDVGQVNDRIFINNSSLGIYARAVLERDAQRRRRGWGKWTSMALAVLKVFRRFPMVLVRMDAGQEAIVRKTPLVFVGNNRYHLDALNVGTRACLDRGELSLYVAHTHTRWGMLKLTVRAMLGRLEQSRDFESYCLSSCWIETRRRRLHVAIDGEVTAISPPLHYRIWPQALRVCLPAQRPQQPGSGDDEAT